MIERALIAALVVAALVLGVSRLGVEVRHSFCETVAALARGPVVCD